MSETGYNERKTHHLKEFTLPEQDGHIVSVNAVGPYDAEAFAGVNTLTELKAIMDPSKPVLLHWTGGPGLPIAKGITRTIDTRHFHLFQVNYRGTVHSNPHGSIVNNTTQHVVDDGKRLMDILGVDGFYMSGFCFGSLIATVMASQMPDQVKAMGLFFPYTSAALDDKWLFQDVATKNQAREALWRNFAAKAGLKKPNYSDLVDAYYRAVQAGDQDMVFEYARYQGEITGCLKLEANNDDKLPDNVYRLSPDQANQVAMELHYAANQYFLGNDGVIPLLPEVRHIPTHVVYSSRNDSFHPDSIKIWKDSLPHASFVDTGLEDHHLLAKDNKPFALEMFEAVKAQSLAGPATRRDRGWGHNLG